MGKTLIILGGIIVCLAIFWGSEQLLDRFGWYDSFQITLMLSKIFLIALVGAGVALFGVVKYLRNGK